MINHGGTEARREKDQPLIARMGADGKPIKAPFPYFGGKRHIIPMVWAAFGSPKQYIEPFCGSAAMLLGALVPARLEVANDINGFIANFWRAVKHQPEAVAQVTYGGGKTTNLEFVWFSPPCAHPNIR